MFRSRRAIAVFSIPIDVRSAVTPAQRRPPDDADGPISARPALRRAHDEPACSFIVGLRCARYDWLMISLSRDECRVLGVLVEKSLTTPGQYPLTLNAVVVGCNQKNNRDPVVELSEDRVYDAMDKLRAKGLARELMLSGSRVPKFRHVAREVLEITTAELVVLAEMLLRGPQTLGELRGRATRMHPIASLEEAQTVLDSLMKKDPPMVRELPPAPGSRAKRYAQLFCPELHPLDHVSREGSSEERGVGAEVGNDGGSGGGTGMGARVTQLEEEVAALRAAVQRLASAVGEADPFA